MGVIADRGQMTVELAVCMPVILVLIIISVDVMVYIGDCARFDRCSGEIVRTCVASPAGGVYGGLASTGEAEKLLLQTMGGGGRISVSVSCDGAAVLGVGDGGGILSFIPQPQIYVCEMTYMPWPIQGGIFGFEPFSLTHTKRFVIDPYRPGALV